MRATRLNHVSIRADDLEESAAFYEGVFGMQRLPTPRFAAPLLWMRLGDVQVHLFQRDTQPPQFEHFALEVDDFEAIYRRTEELGTHDPCDPRPPPPAAGRWWGSALPAGPGRQPGRDRLPQ